MSGFIEGSARIQTSLFPERLEYWVCENNPVRLVDIFVDALDLSDLVFDRTDSANSLNKAERIAQAFNPNIAMPKIIRMAAEKRRFQFPSLRIKKPIMVAKMTDVSRKAETTPRSAKFLAYRTRPYAVIETIPPMIPITQTFRGSCLNVTRLRQPMKPAINRCKKAPQAQ